jgi:geranylgeranyl pyrophosphate synthase
LDSARGRALSLDLRCETSRTRLSLEGYWEAVILKSGSIYRAGAAAGAACASAQEEVIAVLGEYGTAIGVMRQILDDCRDLLFDPLSPDYEISLPGLLYTSQEFDRGHPPGESAAPPRTAGEFVTALTASMIPEVIAGVLAEWRRRALASLERIDPGPGREGLERIADLVLRQEA